MANSEIIGAGQDKGGIVPPKIKLEDIDITFCLGCKHLPVHPQSQFCRMGVRMSTKKRVCKYKRITKRVDNKGACIMQAYLGTKIILAEECSKDIFDENKARGFPVDHDFAGLQESKPDEQRAEETGPKTSEPIPPAIPGYHVVYPNPDGTKYHSWSPKDVFERSYRRIFTDEKELISTY